MFASRSARLARTDVAVRELGVPPAAWKTCPWEPREPIELGLRQWLRCAGVALVDGKIIGMPSRAVDELWHGLILCTSRYARFCDDAYGQFLHHRPEGDHIPGEVRPAARGRRRSVEPAGSMVDQLVRTVAAWELVREPGEACVLWDLDRVLGLQDPWGVDEQLVADVVASVSRT
ncbi:MAG: hypothetical protein JHD16_09830 [Solirubrobacteraceae bacterium]|nr:hypothetical protein [Solirubrobacteraceae bacterium]